MVSVDLNFIKRKRNDNRITLQEMAEILGFKNASTYMKYEKGDYSFKAEHLPAIAERLGCQVQDLFFDNQFAETAKL